jgi:tetratricopeptide (TPR) repeat protein
VSNKRKGWPLLSAIPMVALIGAGLVWWWLRDPSPSEVLKREEIAQVELQLQGKSSTEISVNSEEALPQPQAEAAALKQEAVTVAIEVAEAYPNNALSHALLGSAHYNMGQSEEAIRHLRHCLELDPGQAEAYEILARIAYERGELDEAVQHGQEALERSPANAEVMNQLGRALMDLGLTAEALEVLRAAVRLPQSTSQSHYLLGQAMLQSGEPAQAKESFERAITLIPDHTQAFFGLYTASMRLGQADEAERYREKFLKLEELDRHTLTDRSAQQDTLTGLPFVRETVARTFFGAAQVHGLHEQPAKASELLRKAAALDADSPMYRAALESFYVQRNALTDGVKVFERLAADQPESSWNHFFLARLHERLQQFDAADRAYRKVQQLAPDWPEGYRALADLYLRTDVRPGEARAMARRAVELEPTGPHFYLLALACWKSSDRATALEAINQAVALSPNEPRYQELRQELRKEL